MKGFLFFLAYGSRGMDLGIFFSACGNGLRDGKNGPEFFHHVPGAAQEGGSLADEAVTSGGTGLVDTAGKSEDGAALIGGELSGDEASAGGGGFDHDDANRYAGHETIALGKGMPVGFASEGIFGSHPPLFDDPLVQAEVFGGIDHVDPTPEKGEGLALRVKGAFVGGGVNSAGHPAYDAKSNFGKLLGEFPCEPQAVTSRVPGADD